MRWICELLIAVCVFDCGFGLGFWVCSFGFDLCYFWFGLWFILTFDGWVEYVLRWLVLVGYLIVEFAYFVCWVFRTLGI